MNTVTIIFDRAEAAEAEVSKMSLVTFQLAVHSPSTTTAITFLVSISSYCNCCCYGGRVVGQEDESEGMIFMCISIYLGLIFLLYAYISIIPFDTFQLADKKKSNTAYTSYITIASFWLEQRISSKDHRFKEEEKSA